MIQWLRSLFFTSASTSHHTQPSFYTDSDEESFEISEEDYIEHDGGPEIFDKILEAPPEPTGVPSDVSKEVLISFPYTSRKGRGWFDREAALTMEAAKTSLIVFGATGEGKTKSIAIPALHRLHELGCPGLVLDIVKSDYADLCRRFGNALVIGPVEDAPPINLIAGWDGIKLKDFLCSNLASINSESGGFWGTEGITDAVLIFNFIKEVRGFSPTLADIYEAIQSPEHLVREWGEVYQAMPHLPSVSAIKTRVEGTYEFSAFHVGLDKARLSWKPNECKLAMSTKKADEHLLSQFAWHTSALQTCLRPFNDEKLIKEKLCHSAAAVLDIANLVYLKNKIIVLDMPSVVYGSTATLVGQIIRMEFRDAVLRSGSLRKALGFGTTRFTFILLDEYQRYATGIGNAHGSADENNWSDISREFGNINIYLTQSFSSLLAAAKDHAAVHTVIQNCRNVICLPTFDEKTLELLRVLSAGRVEERASQRMIELSSEREAFVYFARSGRKGKTASGVCYLSGSRFKHMDKNLAQSILEKPAVRHSWLDMAAEKHIHVPQTVEQCLRVIAITTGQDHDGFIDFTSAIAKSDIVLHSIYDMPAHGLPSSRLTLALRKASPTLGRGDILAIVRGGGDRQNMSMFDDAEAVRALGELKSRGVIVVLGVGHTKDRFAIEASATQVAPVPYQAGRIVADIIRSASLLFEASRITKSDHAEPTQDTRFHRAYPRALSAGEALSTMEAMSDGLLLQSAFWAWSAYLDFQSRCEAKSIFMSDEELRQLREFIDINADRFKSQIILAEKLAQLDAVPLDVDPIKDINLVAEAMRNHSENLGLLKASCAAVAIHRTAVISQMEYFRREMGILLGDEQKEINRTPSSVGSESQDISDMLLELDERLSQLEDEPITHIESGRFSNDVVQVQATPKPKNAAPTSLSTKSTRTAAKKPSLRKLELAKEVEQLRTLLITQEGKNNGDE